MEKTYTEHEKQALKDKTDFLSRMSHELFTPLNAIINMSHIASATSDMAKMKSCISTIHDASTQMLSIINNVLDISRLEMGRVSLVKLPFELERALAEAVNIVVPKAVEKDQALLFEIGEGVPPKLRGDEFHLSQLIINLLKNAIKFNEKNGKIEVKVKATGHTADKAVLEFCIACTGTSMQRENREQLEGAFKQLNSDGYLHYGEIELSLVICKKIAEMMGGSLWMGNAEGAGCTLSFNVLMDVFKQGGKEASHFTTETGEFRVLFVDYSIESRQYFQGLMNKHGIDSVCAEDGESAIKLALEAKGEGKPFSAVFIDYHMPSLSGVETAKHIRKMSKDSTVVISVPISEWALVEEIVHTGGFREFLPKPFVDSQIMDILSRIAAQNGKQSQMRTENGAEGQGNGQGGEHGQAREQEEEQTTVYEKYLPYIDVCKGLANIGGNKKLFATMLGSFMNGTVYAELKKSTEENDGLSIQRNYSALINVAQNLSLTWLYRTLIRLERLMRSKKVNFREDILPQTDEAIAETNKKIIELLSEWE
ncbi:MAG: ATP-binding protein [Clostridiales bacterium]|nr:ATP-binding protein [Clostridiales bacterium]